MRMPDRETRAEWEILQMDKKGSANGGREGGRPIHKNVLLVATLSNSVKPRLSWIEVPHLALSTLQGSAKRCSPGCMNAAGRARKKWQAKAGTKLTKPLDRHLAETFI